MPFLPPTQQCQSTEGKQITIKIKKLEIAENKKLSYRRGTARYVVSVEILTTATQQCKNYLYDKIVCKTQVDDLCDKLQWLNVGARRYYKLS